MSYPEVRIGDDHAKGDVESGIYERHRKLNLWDRVLDLGAHVGNFAMAAAPRCAYVIAVEAEPYNYLRLVKNCMGSPNVLCVHAAALDYTGSVVLNINFGNSGGHSINAHTEQHRDQTEVPAIDIGKWLNGLGIRPTFIKIDTEGAELEILRSLVKHEKLTDAAVEIHSEELFKQCRDFLAANHWHLQQGDCPVGVCYVTHVTRSNR